MTPIELTLHNFCQYADYTLTFRTGTTGICGPNGKGKTNLSFVAVFFWLTGVLEKDTKEDYVRWGTTEGWVSGKFLEGDIEYTLKRNLHNSGAILSWIDPVTKKKESEKGITKIDLLMRDILKASPDVILATRFCSQTGLLDILNMTDQVRLAYFQKVTKAMVAEKIRALLQVQIGKLPVYVDQSADITALQTKMTALDTALASDRQAMADLPSDLTEDGLLRERGVISVRLSASSAEAVEGQVKTLSGKETDILEQLTSAENSLGASNSETDMLQANVPTTVENEAHNAFLYTQETSQSIESLKKKLSVFQIVPESP